MDSKEANIISDEICSDESSKEKISFLSNNIQSACQPDQEDFFCEPCLYGDLKTKATHYCKTCDVPELLCNDCANQHTRQKGRRDHELCDDIKEFQMSETGLNANVSQTDQEVILCDPCLYGNIRTKATHFCKTCHVPEPLCYECAQQHTRQKSSRDHELCNDIGRFYAYCVNQKEKQEIFCDPCLYGDIKIKATHYCKTCDVPEPLCHDCAKQHTRQKSSRDHKLGDDIEQFYEKVSNENDMQAAQAHKLFCDPCLQGNLKKMATHFCKTCGDSEPLCKKCADQHIRQRSCRDHQISDVIENFPEKREVLGAFQTEQNDIFCDPCRYGDLKNKATHFCKTCDFPEPLCKHCAQQHSRQKLSRYHELCEDMKKFFSSLKNADPTKQGEVFCDPCLHGNMKTRATHFCKTCDSPEPLCNDCAQQHTRQKLSRDHQLCNEIKKIHIRNNADLTKQGEVFCDPCLHGNMKTKATHFCKTCDAPEPLCNDCAQQHTRQKLSRDHQLCNEIKKIYIRNSEIQKEEMVKFCDPCLRKNVKSRQTHLCKTCDVPEALCKDCVRYHTCKKVSRGHETYEGFGGFPDSEHEIQKEEMVKLCDPCLRKNVKSRQTHLCKTCDVPKALCKDCARYHTCKKVSRSHETYEGFGGFPNSEQCLEKKYEACDNQSPGKPQPTNIKSDTVSLRWKKCPESVNQYQIRYKTKTENAKWKFIETDSDENQITITGLMANTKYIFQVRGIFGDQEGPFSPVNESIETMKSLAIALLDFSKIQNKTGYPSTYLLPVQENQHARNKSARTRQLVLGNPSPDYQEEKTIMLVGATGSGKSTLVDGIANYIMGVSFEDPFRFTMVTLEEEEKKTHNQAISQTEWITVYKIYPTEGSRLSYTLNIIDTPGFGDTRGIERDNAIVDQIRQLFSAKGDQGVLYIDAVCFIVKAPDARLTVVQKYIFSSIMSLFGKDIESNICTLITFADGATPPVLASLKESKLPFGSKFNFNNSALFADNKDLIHNTLAPMFWKMGCSSFEKFFEQICKLQTRSLCQTKNVLDEREQLKTVISNIRPQVTAGLSTLSELQQQLDIFKKYKNEIEDNQNFEYDVDETRQEMVDLPQGQHVTNCLQCNITCHEDCKIADDEKKRGCWAMNQDTGQCRICTGKCIWSDHKNTPYIFKYVTETVTKTYAEMKERYEQAVGQKLTHETYIEKLHYDAEDKVENIMSMMNEMNRCKTRLKEIALRPDPLSAIEHIDLMIQSEETEKQSGYLNRIKMLQEIKRMALVDKDVESFGQNFQLTRKDIESVTGKSFQKRNLGNFNFAMGPTIQTRVRARKKNVLSRGYQYVKKLW